MNIHPKQGQRFGSFVLKSDTGKRHGTVKIWQARCDCGSLFLINSRVVNSGKKKDCGCGIYNQTNGVKVEPTIRRFKYQSQNFGNQKLPLEGRRFGNLSVIADSGQRAKNNGEVLWACDCDCGGKVLCTSSDLVHRGVGDCGCKREARRSNLFALYSEIPKRKTLPVNKEVDVAIQPATIKFEKEKTFSPFILIVAFVSGFSLCLLASIAFVILLK